MELEEERKVEEFELRWFEHFVFDLRPSSPSEAHPLPPTGCSLSGPGAVAVVPVFGAS